MKPTTFEWGWRGYPPQPDPLMNRARMARLFRAWRRSRIQGQRLVHVERIAHAPGRREYRVTSLECANEVHVVVIRT